MPTLIIDGESFHYKTLEGVYGGLHWVLKNNKVAVLHNRDLGMNATVDPCRPKELKRIFNAHNIKSFYKPCNSQTINDFFTDTVIGYSMLNDIQKIKQSGIWILPLYNIPFYPVFVIKDLSEFISGYEQISGSKFDKYNECIRNVEIRDDGLYLGKVEI